MAQVLEFSLGVASGIHLRGGIEGGDYIARLDERAVGFI